MYISWLKSPAQLPIRAPLFRRCLGDLTACVVASLLSGSGKLTSSPWRTGVHISISPRPGAAAAPSLGPRRRWLAAAAAAAAARRRCASSAAAGAPRAAPRRARVMPREEVELEFSAAEWEWLVGRASAHGLPDAGKAFRCCLNYAAQAPGVAGACRERLQALTSSPPLPRQATRLELADGQASWLVDLSGTLGLTAAAVALVGHCSDAVESDEVIFGVVRCKSATPAACEGALSAEAAIAARRRATRLAQALESVDLAAPPRVEVTYSALGPEAAGADLQPRSLVVLDSSFNPPTRAHLHLLTTAAKRFGVERSLLLLAKQNADKPVFGASLVQRLEMMELLAAADESGSTMCGITGHPLFVDKASALQSLCACGGAIYLLVGFDTWVRIMDPRYYGEGQFPVALRTIFAAVQVVVASRDPASAANLEPMSVKEQRAAAVDSLPKDISADRLHFLEMDDAMSRLASSAARQALAGGDSDGARAVIPSCLHEFVAANGLYTS